jgi:D-ribulokinase
MATIAPTILPRTNDDAVFLQAMLEGMARTETEAFQVLQDLGATHVTEILTCGGGAKNHVWTQLRARAVGVPVAAASNGEAAYGAALLARRGWLKDQAEAPNKGVELSPARVL